MFFVGLIESYNVICNFLKSVKNPKKSLHEQTDGRTGRRADIVKSSQEVILSRTLRWGLEVIF